MTLTSKVMSLTVDTDPHSHMTIIPYTYNSLSEIYTGLNFFCLSS